MEGGDSNQDYEITKVSLTPEQKEWIDNQPINFSQLVRNLVDETRKNDKIDSATILSGIISERDLLRSRCQKYEELLEQEEAVERADISSLGDEAGGPL